MRNLILMNLNSMTSNMYDASYAQMRFWEKGGWVLFSLVLFSLLEMHHGAHFTFHFECEILYCIELLRNLCILSESKICRLKNY